MARSREELARQIADVFRAKGFDGASMAQIGEATGLLKGSLYHHFPHGKVDMARAALDAIGEEASEVMEGPLRQEGDPRVRIQRWVRGVERFFDGGRCNCIMGALVLSGGQEPLRDELRAAFAHWIGSLEVVLVEAGLPTRRAHHEARRSVERIQGALIVARALDDSPGVRRALRQLAQDLNETISKETP
ncbi:MAG: helix-turn-helix domain-containing protein [Myxococcota bacterium]